MASYLRDLAKAMANSKKLEWPNSRDTKIWQLDRELGETKDPKKIEEILENLKNEFHNDVVIQGKITKYDLNDLVKNIKYKL